MQKMRKNEGELEKLESAKEMGEKKGSRAIKRPNETIPNLCDE